MRTCFRARTNSVLVLGRLPNDCVYIFIFYVTPASKAACWLILLPCIDLCHQTHKGPGHGVCPGGLPLALGGSPGGAAPPWLDLLTAGPVARPSADGDEGSIGLR